MSQLIFPALIGIFITKALVLPLCQGESVSLTSHLLPALGGASGAGLAMLALHRLFRPKKES